MQKKFYPDTLVWRDYYEDRRDGIRPLGEFAFRFLKWCAEKGHVLLVSDTVVMELNVYFPEEKVKQIFSSFESSIQNVVATQEQISEAKTEWIKRNRELPLKDVIHVVVAKHHNAVLISRDRHLLDELSEIVEVLKPEDVTLD